jgi:hypothetical protein
MSGGFSNVNAMANAEINGQFRYATWRKSPTQVTVQGIWFDLSMSPGNPVPQYYAASPLVATPMSRSTDIGLDHGQNVTTSKRLRKITILSNSATGVPMPMMLLDYLLYYPFCDEGSTDEQAMTNTQTLPRYTDGKGVQIMPVSVAAPIGGQTFRVGYTNSDGVAGRLSQIVQINTAAYVGAIATSDKAIALAAAPFIGLQGGDVGVRSIDSFQMISGTDVGLITLVLVKPLAQLQLFEQTAPVEVDYFMDFAQCPEIQNNAYLNFICCPNASLSGVSLYGDLTTVWSN